MVDEETEAGAATGKMINMKRTTMAVGGEVAVAEAEVVVKVKMQSMLPVNKVLRIRRRQPQIRKSQLQHLRT